MHRYWGPVTLQCVLGDITRQADIDAIVNAANRWLVAGGGVAGAVHAAAGPELATECRQLAPLQPGQAVITSAYRLPNRYVVHCLGPVWGSDPHPDQLLRDCYANALALADRHEVRSIAFPSISTGSFGYPINEAAPIAVKAILDQTPHLQFVRLVRIVLFSPEDLSVYQRVVAAILE
ncbi:MAG: RNase III inhibitor [Sulfobacillus acidophilus]|uniref:RNase III inhibitor n=1 Tax=Sulfobacillus acidophilus TaxID=53633 RepID=A0A2T2WLF0_9FIRM|nr:MAG: RNase III inhibitor [Sulfobacillus acidophilus]